MNISSIDDVEDAVEGAVIEGISAGEDGGLQIDLADGRTILIPDAEIIALIRLRHSH